MPHDHSTTDRQTLNNAMRTAFRAHSSTVRPGVLRDTVNAALRKAAGREATNPEPTRDSDSHGVSGVGSMHRGATGAEGTIMSETRPMGPPYEYHQRIPEQLRRDGWWVGSTRISDDRTAYMATIRHDGRPETGVSPGWAPSREEAVDRAVLDLLRVLEH